MREIGGGDEGIVAIGDDYLGVELSVVVPPTLARCLRQAFAPAKDPARSALETRGPLLVEGVEVVCALRLLTWIKHEANLDARTRLLYHQTDKRPDLGGACHLLSGFSEEILEHTLGGTAEVSHTRCQGRGDDLCRWEGELVESAVTVDGRS